MHDLPAALLALEDGALRSCSPEMSLKAQYVEVLMKIRSQDAMSKEKAVFPLLMPGNAGIHVHKRSADDEARRKLVNLRNRLEGQLQLDFGKVWDTSCAEYKEGLEELAGTVVTKYQIRIEEQVFKRKLLLQNLRESDSGKNAHKLRKSLEATKKNIHELLLVLESWSALRDGRTEESITPDLLRKISTGEFPWLNCVLNSNGSQSAQRHFSQRYRTARCQLDRAQEEFKLLHHEVVRLHNWAEERKKDLNITYERQKGKTMELQSLLGLPTLLTPKEISDIKGKLKYSLGFEELLARDLAWTSSILNDAKARLWKYVQMGENICAQERCRQYENVIASQRSP